VRENLPSNNNNAAYEQYVRREVAAWQKQMQKRPGIGEAITGGVQKRINNIIPNKVHQVITTAFRNMVRGVLAGSYFISGDVYRDATLQMRDMRALDRINIYKNTAAAEGAITGAGGILLGLADFPLWLTIKMKMMFDIALQYGYDVRNVNERIYLLYVFQLAFSSRKHRREIYKKIAEWNDTQQVVYNEMDWLKFQQEYRDYLDLAKLLQLIPGIGAVVGFYVNHKLTRKLGETAMNAYRMRRLGM
jgi:hypothetical protein